MPPRSKIMLLPADVRCQLNIKIRECGYGGSVYLAEWLDSQGYCVSKTAVNEYSKSLRKVDADGGNIDAILFPHTKTVDQQREFLLMQLGELKLREHQILGKLLSLQDVQ